MGTRLELHEELVEVLGSRNVYYQPPETVQLKYPCIIYHKANPYDIRADDKRYLKINRYDLTVISKEADNSIADDLVEHFTYCSYDRAYRADNLYHDALELFY